VWKKRKILERIVRIYVWPSRLDRYTEIFRTAVTVTSQGHILLYAQFDTLLFGRAVWELQDVRSLLSQMEGPKITNGTIQIQVITVFEAV
jgi:hypothetical protein